MDRKLRILSCGEASYLQTGFAIYQQNLLKRLYETGKYEITELAAYCDPSNPEESRWRDVEWNLIPVMPNRNNEQEKEIFKSNPTNEFGEWRFEQALVESKPDVVIDVRDFWHIEFEERSVLRPYFNWCIMPAVDSEPIDEPWLAMCMNADGVFSYSDWGIEVLKKQSNNRMKTLCEAPAGADLDIFKIPDNKNGLKKSFGLDPNMLIVGTVMRNQGRKLYPDLIESFAKFLELTKDKDLGNRTYLYLHTAWPDLGWNIPKLIKEAGIGNKVLMTYACKNCKAAYPGFFQDSITACKFCGQHCCGFPTSQHGINTDILAKIMSMFDVYVQYSLAEGLGMPQIEAAACGVPIMSVDYSAMTDVVRKLNGVPIPIERMVREAATHRFVAYPDNQKFVNQLIDLLSKPEAIRKKMGFDARKGVEKYYTWEKTIEKWMHYLDKLPLTNKWSAKPRLSNPETNVPEGMSNPDFINWCITNICGEPEKVNSYFALRMIRDLNWGVTIGYGMGGTYFSEYSMQGSRPRFHQFDREMALSILKYRAYQKNHWEQQRCL